MTDYYIVLDEVSVGYGKKPLIEHICLRLRRGQVMTLIGPNGAGKSTVLKSITRQLALLCGTICLDGQPMGQMSGEAVSKKMSMLMTDRGSAEFMTCEDMVAAGRYPYTGKLGVLSGKDWEAVRASLRLVHAEELADVPFSSISDGQRQRVLLARALCQEPEILVLDEPTSFLDIRHKLELLTILKDLVRRKKLAVVMSLHEIDLAQKVSDLVVCIHRGKVEKAGTPEEIFTSAYIRELYDMTAGSYISESGCLEMEPVRGKPRVFVIGGNGKGIPVYRRLQREGVPFAAGVLHENDVDYPVAKALAAELIAERAYEPIREECFVRALEVMRSCEKIIVCNRTYGVINEKNRELARLAEEEMGEKL